MELYEKFKKRYLDILSRSYYLSEEVLKNIGNYNLSTNNMEIINTVNFLAEIRELILYKLDQLGLIIRDRDIYLELYDFFLEYESEYFVKKGYKYDE